MYSDEIPDYFEGNFKNGKFHGKGVYYLEYKNKKTYDSKHWVMEKWYSHKRILERK